jgi:hypothetical protein
MTSALGNLNYIGSDFFKISHTFYSQLRKSMHYSLMPTMHIISHDARKTTCQLLLELVHVGEFVDEVL